MRRGRRFIPAPGRGSAVRPMCAPACGSTMLSMTSSSPHLADGLAVQTRGLGKTFGTRVALDSVDLEVPRGSAFGFLGANGAGKTTLIRMLLGLAQPTSGSMRVLGRDLPGERADALARVGAIVEEPRFHPHLSGRENLAIHAAARGARPPHPTPPPGPRGPGAASTAPWPASASARVPTTRSRRTPWACASA